MRALVVFESMFGNTQRIAEAIGRGLRARLPVDVVEVGSAPETLPGDVGLVVVGGPTHAFGLSTAKTRQSAAAQAAGGVVSRTMGVREWVDRLHAPSGVPAATFDTHIDKTWFPGAASKRLEKALRGLGFRTLAAPTSFYVHDSAGPLVGGEVERAELLGRRLGEELLSRQASLQH
jgi:hypothetical protein